MSETADCSCSNSSVMDHGHVIIVFHLISMKVLYITLSIVALSCCMRHNFVDIICSNLYLATNFVFFFYFHDPYFLRSWFSCDLDFKNWPKFKLKYGLKFKLLSCSTLFQWNAMYFIWLFHVWILFSANGSVIRQPMSMGNIPAATVKVVRKQMNILLFHLFCFIVSC